MMKKTVYPSELNKAQQNPSKRNLKKTTPWHSIIRSIKTSNKGENIFWCGWGGTHTYRGTEIKMELSKPKDMEQYL